MWRFGGGEERAKTLPFMLPSFSLLCILITSDFVLARTKDYLRCEWLLCPFIWLVHTEITKRLQWITLTHYLQVIGWTFCNFLWLQTCFETFFYILSLKYDSQEFKIRIKIPFLDVANTVFKKVKIVCFRLWWGFVFLIWRKDYTGKEHYPKNTDPKNETETSLCYD